MSAATGTKPPGEQEVRDDLVVQHQAVEPPLSTRRRLAGAAGLAVAGLVCALVFGLDANPGNASFQVALPGFGPQIPNVQLPGRASCFVLGGVAVVLASVHAVRSFSRRSMRWVVAAAIGCVAISFLCWAATGTPGNPFTLLGLLQTTIAASSVPLILGALGGIACERSGVINVAIEGQLLVGAFMGAMVATMAHNSVAGTLAAAAAGGVIGALLAVFAVKYAVNQVVLGVVLNVLALGLTNFGYNALLQKNNSGLNNPTVLNPIKVPGLSQIPIVGPVLFNQNWLVYVTYVLIAAVHVWLFRTRWGLRTRAVGEHPRAADTVGINVARMRYRNVILGGMIAGIGGAYLTIGYAGAFSGNISSGKGFIALAAVIFGRWSPLGAVGAALLFAFADGLQILLPIAGTPTSIPSAFWSMLPYLATIFAVAGLVGKVQAPAADGEPYVKS
jgi:simple sugar transport system permease protein